MGCAPTKIVPEEYVFYLQPVAHAEKTTKIFHDNGMIKFIGTECLINNKTCFFGQHYNKCGLLIKNGLIMQK